MAAAGAAPGARPEDGDEAAEEEEAGEAPPGAALGPPRRSARMLAKNFTLKEPSEMVHDIENVNDKM